jgi:hypothetical protein
MVNDSLTESIELVSAELVDPSGLNLIGAYTLSTEAGGDPPRWVPPSEEDFDSPQEWRDTLAAWESRLPLRESAIEPEEALQLILVLHPTSSGDCLAARGFRLHYKQFGRNQTVDSTMGTVVRRPGAPNGCDDVADAILDGTYDPD